MKIKDDGPAEQKKRTRTAKERWEKKKKRMQSPAGCAEELENRGTAQIKYGREVGRRLPPTRIIERNDRLTEGSERKVGY